MKIIFLDFDGVLIPSTFSKFLTQMEQLSKGNSSSKDEFGEYFYPECVENLRTLSKKTGALIVFSTNWRNDIEHSKFSKLFLERVNIPIVGFTPKIDPTIGNRGNEIGEFLLKVDHKIEKYVILDDMGPKQFLSHQLPYLVNCNEKFGFTKNDLKKALEILK